MPNSPPAPQIRYVPTVQKKEPTSRRLGRWVLVVVWFMILLVPGFFILMVINGEVSIALGDAPEQKVRVWLLSEIRERGFAISTGSVASRTESEVCVQTRLRYLLWQGTPEPADFCECFVRADPNAEWSFTTSWQGECTDPPPERNTP